MSLPLPSQSSLFHLVSSGRASEMRQTGYTHSPGPSRQWGNRSGISQTLTDVQATFEQRSAWAGRPGGGPATDPTEAADEAVG